MSEPLSGSIHLQVPGRRQSVECGSLEHPHISSFQNVHKKCGFLAADT